jgi:hypothetical protein
MKLIKFVYLDLPFSFLVIRAALVNDIIKTSAQCNMNNKQTHPQTLGKLVSFAATNYNYPLYKLIGNAEPTYSSREFQKPIFKSQETLKKDSNTLTYIKKRFLMRNQVTDLTTKTNIKRFPPFSKHHINKALFKKK